MKSFAFTSLALLLGLALAISGCISVVPRPTPSPTLSASPTATPSTDPVSQLYAEVLVDDPACASDGYCFNEYMVFAGGKMLKKFIVQEMSSTIQAKIAADFPSFSFSGLSIRGSLIVTNIGKTVLKDQKVDVESDLSPSQQVFTIDSLPPFGKKVIPVSFHGTPFLTNKSFEVTMLYEGNSLKKTIRVGVVPDNYWIFGGGIVAVFTFISVIAWASWRLFIQRPKR